MSNTLIIRFTDTSESFCNGVEFGRILSKMERGEEYIDNCLLPVKIANIETIRNACKHYGYIPSFGEEFYEWIYFIGFKKTTSEN